MATKHHNQLMSETNVHAQTFFQDYSVNIAVTVTKFSGCSSILMAHDLYLEFFKNIQRIKS